MSRRTFWTLSLALAALLAFASCLPFELPFTAEKPLATPQDQTLFLLDNGPVTLDPAVSGDAGSHGYIVNIFSGLVGLGSDLSVVPDLASKWEIADGGRTYTFHLLPGARFHDGRTVKAADFKYSFERAASPTTKSKTAETYLGDIVGVKDVLQGKAREISGVKVIDDSTLRITIDQPKVYFLAKLTYPTACVVDRKNAESGSDWWVKPNGTGPFKVRQFLKDQRIVLERNDAYYRTPALTRYVVFLLNAGNPMQMYERGDIDVSPVGFSYLDRVTDPAGPLSRQLSVSPESSVTFIGFNVSRPPFDDASVRKAFALATNRNMIAGQIMRGYLQPAPGLLPEGFPGHNKDVEPLDFDPQAARRTLQASRYGSSGLPPVVMTMSGTSGNVPPGFRAVVSGWQRVLGVSISIRQLDPELFSYSLKEEKDNLYAYGWVADYPDPQDFLDVLFRTGSPQNIGEYSNSQVDAVLDQASRETDRERRIALYRQTEQMLVDDAAFIPLWFGRSYTLVKPYVSGYVDTPMGYPLLKNVSVARP